MTLLWLDDIRNPFVANWIMQFAPKFCDNEEGIVWVKNYDEFIKWINSNGLPDMIAFDHDLGEGKSGYDCAKFLVDYCIDNQLKLPNWVVQSANPVGRENINALLFNYKKLNK
jgi:hypothetical protein